VQVGQRVGGATGNGVSFIDSRSKVLRYVDRLSTWREGGKPGPVTVEWDLSNRCSLGCQDCHFAHTHTKGPWVAKTRHLPMAYDGTGDLADTELALNVLPDLYRAGVKGIVWSGGGEPTLHPDWQRIVAKAAGIGLQQGMYTLGGHLTEQSATFLGEKASWVVVSLDAPDPHTYAKEKGVPEARFEAACQGIRWLSAVRRRRVLKSGAVVGVSFLLHDGNWQRTGVMLGLARELGATYATFRPAIRFNAHRPSTTDDNRSWVTQALWTLQRLSEEADVEIDVDRFLQYRDWQGHGYVTCYGIRVNATITPDGRVWICPNRRGMPGSCLGDLRTESFRALWARHPASFQVNEQCRVMCRLHPINEVLHAIESPQQHEAFV
jgi:GTP 3',8-cyclase